jgi:methionine aminotransferase
MNIASKLPQLQPSIFSVMTAMANEHGAINLAQGFPNYPCDPRLINLVVDYLKKGMNQYAPMGGVPALQKVLSEKIQQRYGQYYQASEITITAGATQALYGVFAAMLRPSDEVIIFEPAYDSYQPVIESLGGIVRPYALHAPSWQIDWVALGQLVNDKTRMIVFNTPHNPTGKLWKDSDYQALMNLVKDNDNLFLLSDEVYEHLTFDGRKHQSILAYPSLRERSFAVYSFGKTLHATGWKLGYVVADEPLSWEFRKIHQFNVFCANAPMQYAIADYLQDADTYEGLPKFFQEKRDYFMELLGQTPLRCLPCEGTYFLNVSYKHLSEEPDTVFAQRLIKNYGVASIPVSAFYADRLDQQVLRLCFAKTNETLEQAAQKLAKLRGKGRHLDLISKPQED